MDSPSGIQLGTIETLTLSDYLSDLVQNWRPQQNEVAITWLFPYPKLYNTYLIVINDTD